MSYRVRVALALLMSLVVVTTTAYFGTTGVESKWGETAAYAFAPFWVFVALCIGNCFGRWAGK
jgi:surface polysaccharide O-acyltransferase-like enzyme